jgi:hypothetical protein
MPIDPERWMPLEEYLEKHPEAPVPIDYIEWAGYQYIEIPPEAE